MEELNMIQLREYGKSDYDQVAQLWIECFGDLRAVDSKEHLDWLAEKNPGLFLVAVDGEKLVGTIFAGHDGRQATIHRLAVSHDYRRRGTGKVMLKALLQRLDKLKPIEVHVHSAPDPWVLKLFEDAGFQRRANVVYMKKVISRRDY